MLVPKHVIDNIDMIVQKAYINFTFDLLGKDYLTQRQKDMVESLGLLIGQKPLIELLYMLVRQRSEERYLSDKTLNQLLSDIVGSGFLDYMPDQEQATLNNAKDTMQHVIESSMDFTKKKIKQEIIKINHEYKQAAAINIADDESRKSYFLGLLFLGIGTAVASSSKEFKRDITTATTNMVNNTVADAAKQSNKLAGVMSEPLVYKRVVNDGHLCIYCDHFYTAADGSPRVFTLSELQKNGSNEGKKKSQWKPTLDSTHPRCRCQLLNLPVGFLFQKGNDALIQVDVKEWMQSIKKGIFTK